MNKKGRFRALLLIWVVLGMLITNTSIYDVRAEVLRSSQETEKELIDIISKYGEENIIFENGIVINKDEQVQLTEALRNDYTFEEVISNNEEILKVNGSSINGVNEGTTFLIIRSEEYYHVLEVYVQDEGIAMFDAKATMKRNHYVVYVDAGHGGYDPGTLERDENGNVVANGMKEKDLNLTISLKIRDKLKNLGVEVVMNRETDVYVNYKDTAAHANRVNPDVFISIHNNSSTSPSVNGIESFYTKNIDIEFATGIHNELIANTKAYNRGLKQDLYYVTNHTTMPAILVEGGFLSNPAETAKLKQDYYQEIIADSIVEATMEYLNKTIPLSEITSQRIYGATRYETSYKLFENGWTSADTVVLVSGADYPDALSAAPLAGKYNGPILLVKNDSLSNQSELKNLLINKGVKKAYIIGGTGVIPSSFESELKNIGIDNTRLGGKNRFETSALIAEEVGTSTGEVVITSGYTFADGISISSIAAMNGMPILLTEANAVPDSIRSFLDNNNITKTYVIGGDGVVGSSIVSTFEGPERLGGATRYETNEIVFNRFKNILTLDTLYLATGTAFPDALSSSAAAVNDKSFVILTDNNIVKSSVNNIINNNRSLIKKVNILSGSKVISDSILKELGIKLS